MYYFIGDKNLKVMARRLLEKGRVFGPLAEWGENHLEELTADNLEKINLSGFRTVETLKAVFFKISEKVSAYFGEDVTAKGESITLLGVRGCDLEGLEVLDRVYLEGDFQDPFYASARRDKFIIGSDCTACGKSCFCNLVNGKPFPAKLFDLNFSIIRGGYLVEAGTDKGEDFVSLNNDLFINAADDLLRERAQNRERVEKQLEEVNHDFQCRCTIEWSEAHKTNIENAGAWRAVTKDCVECSGCNFICPTCTCFLLVDQNEADKSVRYKLWDACLKDGYARVAGGANSRPKLYERLQNRYHCKFDYSKDRLGRYTCVGCGRCLDGCAGNIDMRKVYAELVRQVPLTAKLE